MTKSFKVELTVNMHSGKITSMYVDHVEEKPSPVDPLEVAEIEKALREGKVKVYPKSNL